MPIGILWPTFALVALVFAVWAWMFVIRFGHMRRNPPPPETFADRDASARYFRPVAPAGDNLANLFEMPVLYFALVPLLLVTHHGNHVQVLLAWSYVALRFLHSLIHVGANKVQLRFMVYLASCAVLLAMWLGLAIDIGLGQ